MNNLSIRDRIIVALDVPTEKEALDLVARFEGELRFVKVGMELFYGAGYPIIEKLQKLGIKIFLDLKLHDIPNTVGRAAAQLTKMGVEMFNVHVAGGIQMMEEARNQIEKNLAVGQKRPLLIGVTQLTSTDEKILHEQIGIPYSMEAIVTHYAKLAKKAGLDGVVSSPLDVPKIKGACGIDFLTVTPGIRFLNGDHHDQKRITTPEQAFQFGSDYIVVGRMITEAKEPAKQLEEIVRNVEKQILN
ncbi:orotidine-5'-phosphate decarboxylase [Tepidibacillus fermentans]|uniref:Orotidine 5'-phosphate decarboxylase n=1 Tax=Tepidibacillus fermentans TaxID=1281767 RepID=A0A4R3KKH0_9BACI|nr:orotidine-5'-phosphate decarboxylase [Tepidibacillus fermentans]TCS84381.1 orotidine-5'-phosphate decarboxylase [Tepidibacillus fermentans]